MPPKLSNRVTRMLASIEKELDAVESKIGQRMHVLDTDQDGAWAAWANARVHSGTRSCLHMRMHSCMLKAQACAICEVHFKSHSRWSASRTVAVHSTIKGKGGGREGKQKAAPLLCASNR